jgi:arginine decarboxylase
LSTDQNATPLFDAVKNYIEEKVIPFHVPGHKQGKGLPELRNYVGERVLQMDVNGMNDLDYLNNPAGVILEAQNLLADAFRAEEAFFLVNGTTAGVQAMIMSVCDPGSEIIIPRNAHKSTIGGIILSGAMPVYVYPEINHDIGLSMNVTLENIYRAIQRHPHAKAVFLLNPTYYGHACDLKAIVRIAHAHNMAVLVDEAHGAHMSFHNTFPLTAMEAGADMSAASLHKTAGSLTQSSVLLMRGNMVNTDKVKQTLNLSCTSSASYLLMCSLDIARKQLATRGAQILENTLRMVIGAREKLNEIPGVYAFGKELTGTPGCFDWDETKLGINLSSLSCSGYQVENKLRTEFGIQIEMSDLNNILAICGMGDQEEDYALLINAIQTIASQSRLGEKRANIAIPAFADMIVSPRDAFYSNKKTLRLEDASGEIAGEMIMAYPPGIPVICMGEKITKDIIDYIKILKQENCALQGPADPRLDYIQVLGSA